jgi:branched-chain amino acid aminotransferase
VTQRVSRGLDASGREIWPQAGATVIVECVPLPLRDRAPLYRDGIRVLVPSVRRTPPEAMSPRVKTHNYLNMVAANLEIAARDPEAWAVLLDTNGNLAEGLGSNIFLVSQGTLYTPREQFVLAGISRDTVMTLAREAGLSVVEKDLDLFDAYNARRCSSPPPASASARCAASTRRSSANGRVPGPVTRQLTEAYCRFVDFDFVAQYLKRLG